MLLREGHILLSSILCEAVPCESLSKDDWAFQLMTQPSHFLNQGCLKVLMIRLESISVAQQQEIIEAYSNPRKDYPLQGTKTHYISFDTILNSVHFGQSFLHSNNEVDPQKMSRQITALAFQVLLGPLITQKSHFW